MRLLAVVIIGIVLFMPFLGLRGLCEPDEGRYAEIAREMIESGDFITPHLNYIKHFHKPPLIYWLVAFSFQIFGENEFAARFPAALFGVLGLVLVYLLALKLGCDKRKAFFASLVLASCGQYFVWTQVLSSDMILSVLVLLAFYGFFSKNILFGIGMGLGFMVKGPIAVIIPILVLLAYRFASKEKYSFGKFFIIQNIAVFLVIALPWYIYVSVKNPGLFKYFIFFQSVERMLSKVHGRHGSILYFIPIFLIGTVPWIAFLPKIFKNKSNLYKLLIIWIVCPIVFFSFSKSKLPGYILPVYPAFAILIGSYFGEKKTNKLFYSIFAVFCLLSLVSITVLPKYEEKLGGNLSIRKPAEIINRNCGPNDTVINYKCFLQGLPFYVKKRVVLIQHPRETQFENKQSDYKDYLAEDLKSYWQTQNIQGNYWIFTRKDDVEDLKENTPFPLSEVWSASGYALFVRDLSV